MIKIAYHPDDLMTNAPFGANPHTSTAKWADLVLQAANDLGLDCRDVYAFDVLDDTWMVDGFIKHDDFSVLIAEIDRITESDWYDYSPQERDYEYMGG